MSWYKSVDVDDDISLASKVFLGVCAAIGSVFGLVVFAVFSGGSIFGYVLAAIGGVALGLLVASKLRGLLDWFDS